MVKRKKVKSTKTSRKKKNTLKWSDWWFHGAALATFLILNIAYFYPQLRGEVIIQPDISANIAASRELSDYYKEHGKPSLWTNSMFSGMPAYQIGTPYYGNKLKWLERSLNLFIKRPIGYFLAIMICFYIMGLCLGWHPWVAMVTAAAFGFSTDHFILFDVGHTSKIRAIAFFSFVVAGMATVFRKRYVAGALLFAAGMALEIGANHIQMTYYLFLALLVYALVELVWQLRSGSMHHYFKAMAFLFVAGLIGIGANTSRLWTNYEYAQETMRGDPVLEVMETDTTIRSTNTEGLQWEYAMDWSNDWRELITTFIPGFTGGSNEEPIRNAPQLARMYANRGSGQNKVSMYWGSLTTTAGPPYIGAIIFFLFVLGCLAVKHPIKWWLLCGVILTLLISMGKNLEWFNRFLFDHFPLFNKFRTPNSIMPVTAFLAVTMAGVTLSEIYKKNFDAGKIQKQVLIALGLTAGLCLIFLIGSSAFFSFSGGVEDRFPEEMVPVLREDRAGLLRKDAFRSMMFIILGAGLIWMMLREKIGRNWVVLSIGVLLLIDLWTTGRRYLNEESFQEKSEREQLLLPRAVDETIMRDPDLHYRVLDVSVNTFRDAKPSYHHKTIGGYHAAKLQRYQDLIDYYIRRGHLGVVSMLNTKFVITKEEEPQINRSAYGNAWVVSNMMTVGSANEEIRALNSADLRTTAVVHEEFSDYVRGISGSSGSVRLTSYQPNELRYESNLAEEGLVVFSEIWYGPDKGWYCYIDDEPAEHIRVNYALRGLRVPTGMHQIRFEFKPRSYYKGEIIASAFSIPLFIFLILALINWIRPFQSGFMRKIFKDF